MTEHDDKFEQDVRTVLQEAEHGIDPDTLRSLTAARQAAVAAVGRGGQPASSWLPVGALAATVLAVGVAFVALDRTPAETTTVATMPAVFEDEFETLAAADLELLEDLEFLAWMESQAEPGNAG